jgi:phosphatidylserine decarboxylase
MRLAPAGLREWGLGGIIAVAIVVIAWWLIPIDWLNWAVTGLASLAWFCTAAFFRDPHRSVPSGLDAAAMLSPADGVISAIETLDEHEAVGGPAIVVRIFLSVLNVHINRMPCDVDVIDLTYRPGKFLDARKPESAKVNESMLIRLRRSDQLPMGVRQVSGAIARRIVCPLVSGQQFKRGDRFGMIKFGSTTELIVPADSGAEVRVVVGDTVTAGITVLASVPLRA